MTENNTEKEKKNTGTVEDEKSSLDQLKDKSVKFLKTTKGKVVAGISVAGLVLSGVFWYSHYENTKPVGNGDQVVTTQSAKNKKNVVGRDVRAKNVLATQADGTKSNDRGFKYLFESPIAVSTSAFKGRDKKPEFNGSTNFITNLVTLLTTKDKGDVNSAAALYARNASNYKFTTDDNLIAVGIGKDATLFYDYLSKTDKISTSGKLELERNFARKFKNRIGTPFSGVAIASNLSVYGLEALVIDDSSTAIISNVKYTGSKQFKNYEDALQKSTKITIDGTNKNATLDAWNQFKDTNSVYEVYLKGLDDDRDVVGVVIEDQQGRLTLYGLYYRVDYSEDQRVRLVRQMRQSGVDTNTGTVDDINWDIFRSYT